MLAADGLLVPLLCGMRVCVCVCVPDFDPEPSSSTAKTNKKVSPRETKGTKGPVSEPRPRVALPTDPESRHRGVPLFVRSGGEQRGVDVRFSSPLVTRQRNPVPKKKPCLR